MRTHRWSVKFYFVKLMGQWYNEYVPNKGTQYEGIVRTLTCEVMGLMSRAQRVWLAVGALVAIFATAAIVWVIVEDDEPDEEGVMAVIDNRVTNGPTMMREDDAP